MKSMRTSANLSVCQNTCAPHTYPPGAQGVREKKFFSIQGSAIRLSTPIFPSLCRDAVFAEKRRQSPMKNPTRHIKFTRPRRCCPSPTRTDRPRTGTIVNHLIRHRAASVSTHLTDILVPHTADLLDVCGALGNILEVITGELELVLDVLRRLDVDTGVHHDPADVLLAQEVAVTHISASYSRQILLRHIPPHV